ncbi:hypothetical protein ABPG74_008817 [Tetrahymena malaccensis]
MSNPPQGYDKKRFQNCTSEDFDCNICTEVAKYPKQCKSCKKCFCGQCIDDWLKKSKQCPLRCEGQPINSTFFDKNLERQYLNLNLKCVFCNQVFSIKVIEEHEKECSLPKCQNYINCNNRIDTNTNNSQLTKIDICSPECQFFLNILNHSSNQRNLYREISNFMQKNYPNIDGNEGQIQAQLLVASRMPAPTPLLQYPFNQSQGQYNLTWDPNCIGSQIQIKNENFVFLKEQAYIFRSALTKQGFSQGIHYWEIEPDDKSENEMKIGVSLKNNFDFNTAFCDHQFGFAYYGIGQLRSGNNAQGQSYGMKFKQQGILGVHLNMNLGTLSFSLNGQFFGIAFNDPKLKQGPIYPAVAMLHCAGCKITYKSNIPPFFPK